MEKGRKMIIENEKVGKQILESRPYQFDTEGLTVSAVLVDGSTRPLADTCGAPKVREQIALWHVRGLICFIYRYLQAEKTSPREGGFETKDFEGGLPVLDNGEGVEFYIPLKN
jgi:hypothetical protein